MQEIQRLVEIEELKQLKARYFRYVDDKDWQRLEALFCEDALLDVSEMEGHKGLIHGASEIVGYVRKLIANIETLHHGYTPEVSITSSNTAESIWAMEDLWRWPPGAKHRSLHGWGYYHETYVKSADGWRIQTLKLTRTRVDID